MSVEYLHRKNSFAQFNTPSSNCLFKSKMSCVGRNCFQSCFYAIGFTLLLVSRLHSSLTGCAPLIYRHHVQVLKVIISRAKLHFSIHELSHAESLNTQNLIVPVFVISYSLSSINSINSLGKCRSGNAAELLCKTITSSSPRPAMASLVILLAS